MFSLGDFRIKWRLPERQQPSCEATERRSLDEFTLDNRRNKTALPLPGVFCDNATLETGGYGLYRSI